MMDGITDSLVEAVNKIQEKKTKEQQAINDFIRKELDKLGADSPADLTTAQKKTLFNKVDQAFTSDGEADGTDLEPDDKENKKKVNEARNNNIDEASDLGDVGERFFQVEILNGETGRGAVFEVAAIDRRTAKKMAIDAAKGEDDLKMPGKRTGTTLVVDSVVEISEDEFNEDDINESAQDVKFKKLDKLQSELFKLLDNKNSDINIIKKKQKQVKLLMDELFNISTIK